jgi:hypothetical protein
MKNLLTLTLIGIIALTACGETTPVLDSEPSYDTSPPVEVTSEPEVTNVPEVTNEPEATNVPEATGVPEMTAPVSAPPLAAIQPPAAVETTAISAQTVFTQATTEPKRITAPVLTTAPVSTQPPATNYEPKATTPFTLPPPTPRARQLENMSGEEFLDAFLNDKFPANNIYRVEDFGTPVANNEFMDYQSFYNLSASSREQAQQMVVNHYNEHSAQVLEIEFIGENQYFYSFRVNLFWQLPQGHSVIRAVILKNEIYYYTPGGHFFRKLDKETIKNMMDIRAFTGVRNFPGSDIVIYSTVYETEAEFIYTWYRATTEFSNAILVKRTTVIDKPTGQIINWINAPCGRGTRWEAVITVADPRPR